MMHPLFACRQLNAGPLQTQRLWSSNSMTLDTKLNAIGHQTQCYWISPPKPIKNRKIGLRFLDHELTS